MTERTPDVSVLIPTFNRRDVILRCLADLDRQTLAPEQMEIVVIDDGSKDDTLAAVRAAGAGMRFKVICEAQSNAGASAARNHAMRIAAGRIFLIINDDTFATPGMVAAHMRLHDAEPSEEVAVLGPLDISSELPDSIFLHLHHDTYLDNLPDRYDLGWQFFMTFNISAKAALLRRCDGFDSTLRWHEDVELGMRLSKFGLRVLFAKEALGYHYHPMDEAKYFRIADGDGKALATWYSRNPELLPDLVLMGLHSARLGTREPRHKVADVVFNQLTWPLWLGLARALSGPRRDQAMQVYRKLFQWRKRRALDAALAASRS
jgi:GT2 family glycosyltransferase